VLEDTQLKREQSVPLAGEPTASLESGNAVLTGSNSDVGRSTAADDPGRGRSGGLEEGRGGMNPPEAGGRGLRRGAAGGAQKGPGFSQ
jgi:hypothetical protein